MSRVAQHRTVALARMGVSACRQLKDARLHAVVEALGSEDRWMNGVAG